MKLGGESLLSGLPSVSARSLKQLQKTQFADDILVIYDGLVTHVCSPSPGEPMAGLLL